MTVTKTKTVLISSVARVVLFSIAVIGLGKLAISYQFALLRTQTPQQPVTITTPSENLNRMDENTIPDFIPGQLLVKFKTGKTLEDVRDLSQKYMIDKSRRVFTETPNPEARLDALQKQLAVLNSYKSYSADIASLADQTLELQKQIQVQQLLVEKIKQRQARVTGNVITPQIDNIYILESSNVQIDTKFIVDEYRKNPAVDYAEPNYLAQTQSIPNDPLYSQQWAHTVTNAPQGWDVQVGNPNTIIAIVDTGVDYTHEDLSANIWRDALGNPGKDFVDINTSNFTKEGLSLIAEEDYNSIDLDPRDFNGHGTHVAGIAAATGNNGIGVSGVCQKCSIMPVRAGFSILLGSRPLGLFEIDDIVSAILYASDNGADVINMSFGAYFNSRTLKDAIDYAFSKGSIVVAAAGNDDGNELSYPAGYDNVIAVAATGSNNKKSTYSNYGYWVDISAPGGYSNKVDDGILSTVPRIGSLSNTSGYKKLSGTSMASPYVSGVIGLMLAKDPSKKQNQVQSILANTADSIATSSRDVGFGRINNYKATQIVSFPKITASITSPKRNSWISDGNVTSLTIKGVVTGNNFIIEVGSGAYPRSWRNINNGKGPVADGVLGTIDMSLLSEGMNTFRLKSSDATGEIFDRVVVFIYKNQSKGFPIEVEGKISTDFHLAAHDIDSDGYDEFFVGETVGSSGNRTLGTLKVVRRNGLYENWPSSNPQGMPNLTASVGDLNNDGSVETVVSESIPNSYPPKNLLIIYDNKGRPVVQKAFDPDFLYSIPTLADINNDGKLEIILTTTYPNSFTVRILDYQGNQIVSKNFSGRTREWSNLAVADFNGDGKKDIAVPLQNAPFSAGLMIVDDQLSVLYSKEWSGVFTLSNLIAADVDSDSRYELYFGIADLSRSITTFHSLELRNSVGSVATVKMINNSTENNLQIAMGDLNKDNVPELVTVLPTGVSDTLEHSRLFAIDINGNLVIEKKIQHITLTNGSPLVGDIDGDGKSDIVIGVQTLEKDKTFDIYESSDNYLLAFDYTGTPLTEFPKLISPDNYYLMTPAIADFDGDNITDIAVGLGFMNHFEHGNRVLIYKGSSPYNKSTMQWPMFGGNARHDGVYGAPTQTPIKQFTLTLNMVGKGTVSGNGVTCSATCQTKHNADTVLTLKAVPTDGNIFDQWVGCSSVSGATCTVTMDSSRGVVAIFQESITGSHSECVNNACLQVAGAGINTCSNNAECTTSPPQFHLECINNSCTQVQGPGANQCAVSGAQCNITIPNQIQAPDGISCSSTIRYRARISWQKVTNASSYKIQRSLRPDFSIPTTILDSASPSGFTASKGATPYYIRIKTIATQKSKLMDSNWSSTLICPVKQ